MEVGETFQENSESQKKEVPLCKQVCFCVEDIASILFGTQDLSDYKRKIKEPSSESSKPKDNQIVQTHQNAYYILKVIQYYILYNI